MTIGGFDQDILPFFPPLCTLPTDVDIARGECSLLGITVPCLPNFNEKTLDVMGIQLQGMHIWTTLATVFVGVVCLRGTGCKNGMFYCWQHSMAVTAGYFAIFTGLFALFRFFWGVSRPLLVAGVLHNLTEWFIIIHLTSGITQASSPEESLGILKKRLSRALVFEVSLISVGILIPSLRYGFGSVQALGIMLDIAFPILFLPKWIADDDDDVRDFYKYPAIAHAVHLFLTILPLAFSIFFSVNSSWFSNVIMEGLIHVTVPLTHLLYALWAWEVFDKKAWKSVDKEKGVAEYALQDKFQLPYKHVRKVFILSLVIGVVFFGLIPVVLGPCEKDASMCFHAERAVSGTSTVHVKQGYQLAFEDLMKSKKVVETANEAPGSVYYKLIQDVYYPGHYQIMEQWSSMSSYRQWKIDSDPIFEAPEVKRLLIGGKFTVKGPFSDLPDPSCSTANRAGAQTFEVTNTCSGVWEIIEREKACFWIPGCEYATARSSTGSGEVLTLEMDNGRILKARNFETDGDTRRYEVKGDDKLTGFLGSLSTTESIRSGSCMVRYEFSVPKHSQLSTSDVQDFFSTSISKLKRFLARGGGGRGRKQFVSLLPGY